MHTHRDIYIYLLKRPALFSLRGKDGFVIIGVKKCCDPALRLRALPILGPDLTNQAGLQIVGACDNSDEYFII